MKYSIRIPIKGSSENSAETIEKYLDKGSGNWKRRRGIIVLIELCSNNIFRTIILIDNTNLKACRSEVPAGGVGGKTPYGQ